MQMITYAFSLRSDSRHGLQAGACGMLLNVIDGYSRTDSYRRRERFSQVIMCQGTQESVERD